MEAHICNHPLVPHTVIWWGFEDDPMSSQTRRWDTLEEADLFAQRIIRSNPERLETLQIHRSDNASYVCYTWESPEKGTPVVKNEAKVTMEVDMEPFKEVFDNVAKGFADQGKAITRLKISQAITIILLVVDAIGHLI